MPRCAPVTSASDGAAPDVDPAAPPAASAVLDTPVLDTPVTVSPVAPSDGPASRQPV